MKKFLFLSLIISLIGSTKTKATPTLNSYPAAISTIYLDFDGQDVKSSMWNYGTSFSAAPATMTDAQITEAFNRVSEDFRPFNINITTDLAKFLAAPLDQRIRVIITPTSAWYPAVSGIAYVTSFTWGDDTPCFVFSDRLVNDGKRVAEAISHETGHTLGLYHQSAYTSSCTLTSSYHTGIGTGETSWGPIMGNVASKNLTQWNFGPTPNGCSFLQDNLSIITTTNGFTYRPDDFGDIYSTAGVVNVASNIFSKVGVISTSADKDIFRFDLSLRGKFNLNANPYSVGNSYTGANLDVKIELQDSKGTTIKVYDAADALNVIIDTTLNAGTYYVIVDGTGNVNSKNDYGSLGSYTLTGTYTGTAVSTTTTTTSTSTNSSNEISGIKVKGGNKLSWAKNTIKNGEAMTLVYATENVEDFTELSRPDGNTTSYVHKIVKPEIYTYKLKIIEKNGSIRFSNTVTINAKNNTGIFKIIKQIQQPIVINSTEEYEFQVVDNFGRVIQAGKAPAGSKSIDVRNYPSGIYNIKVNSESEEKIEAFMNK
jgi:hypothetical protein